MTESILDKVLINFDSGSLWVMNLVLGLVMFGVALEISISDFKPLWSKPKALLVGLTSQFILLPAITFLLVHIWAISGGFYPSIRLDHPDRAVFYAGRCKRVCHCEKRPDFWGLSWFTSLTGIGGRRYLIAPCWDDLADLSL